MSELAESKSKIEVVIVKINGTLSKSGIENSVEPVQIDPSTFNGFFWEKH